MLNSLYYYSLFIFLLIHEDYISLYLFYVYKIQQIGNDAVIIADLNLFFMFVFSVLVLVLL